ncbi:hypothetical protein DFJ58DRAFT_870585 [Suillus subalutaceus]|uniref:uncharacterized protein n=1 Tax=Suillus subalutaceus TaxID=48586 RepID=UPI001B8772A9|nr:uncharacterized protein DFJ58DRAFT_870585 [Suillus subalutaceus]KAG1832565.1 hypothetical protein DFJ58DRAFT_870585 [Suillus subalutaceus]
MILVVIFVPVVVTCGVMVAIAASHTPGEEYILSGTYQCTYVWEGDARTMDSMAWALYTMWEALALCLALWIAVKYFRGLRQPSNIWTIEDLFTVLMKTHVAYFASFATVSCFQLVYDSATIDASSMGYIFAVLEFFWSLQLFVLGPRLILSVREYHAKFIPDSDAETGISAIAFQDTGETPSDDHLVWWHIDAGEAYPLSDHFRWVWSVAISSDGNRIVSGSYDNLTIQVWDIVTGKASSACLPGHTDYVLSVAISPDVCRIMSDSRDKTIRVWDEAW